MSGRPASPARRVVSATSVGRFTDRARGGRRVTVRGAALIVAGLAAVLLTAWVVLLSPLLVVRGIEVTGTQRLAPAQVESLAAGSTGVPLARVDVGGVAHDVRGLPAVRDVTVHRSWPSTLRIDVVERTPVAALPAAGGYELVDSGGAVLATVPEAPDGVPRVDVDIASAGGRTVREVAAVLTALPADLRQQVEAAGATSRDSVTLKLAGGDTVVWGSADDFDRKVRVLRALLATEASVYDVSAPDLPVTR